MTSQTIRHCVAAVGSEPRHVESDIGSGLNTEYSLRNVCTWIDLFPLPIEWKQIYNAERTTNNKRKNKFNKYTCAPSPSTPCFDFRQRHAPAPALVHHQTNANAMRTSNGKIQLRFFLSVFGIRFSSVSPAFPNLSWDRNRIVENWWTSSIKFA